MICNSNGHFDSGAGIDREPIPGGDMVGMGVTKRKTLNMW